MTDSFCDKIYEWWDELSQVKKWTVCVISCCFGFVLAVVMIILPTYLAIKFNSLWFMLLYAVPAGLTVGTKFFFEEIV